MTSSVRMWSAMAHSIGDDTPRQHIAQGPSPTAHQARPARHRARHEEDRDQGEEEEQGQGDTEAEGEEAAGAQALGARGPGSGGTRCSRPAG